MRMFFCMLFAMRFLELWEKETEAAGQRDTTDEEQMKRFWEALPGLDRLPLQVRHFFLEVWSAYSGTGWYWSGVRSHLDPAHGKRIAQGLLAPFEHRGTPQILTDEFADYATTMLQALKLSTRVPVDSTEDEEEADSPQSP